MMQIERTVTAVPRLSRIEGALPQGFHEADPAELANVEGGFLGILIGLAGAALAYGIAKGIEKLAD
jgi:lactobin A/cerein 7B family class IIb bacteriocin